MNPLLLNILVFAIALLVLFSVWVGVHLLARHRMGDRKLGCRGPTVDEQGNTVCCNSGARCDRDNEEAVAGAGIGRSGEPR